MVWDPDSGNLVTPLKTTWKRDTMNDAFGETLSVGDYVGYVPSGDGSRSFKGRITKIQKMIQVEVTDVSYGGWKSVEVGGTKWLHPHRTTRTLKSFWRVDRDKERFRD